MPIGPAPITATVSFKPMPSRECAFHAAAERLRERHLIVGNLGGDLEQISLPHRRRRHPHERRERAVVVVTHRGAMRGEVFAAHLHVSIAAIDDDDVHHHPIAHLHIRLRCAGLRDRGGEFVTENPRRNDLLVAVPIGPQIRAADRARLDFQQHLALCELRFRDILNGDIFFSEIDSSFHEFIELRPLARHID